jgi:hypothetical protein
MVGVGIVEPESNIWHQTLPMVVLPDPVALISGRPFNLRPGSSLLQIDSAQSIEFIPVQTVSQVPTPLNLEIVVHFVDDIPHSAIQLRLAELARHHQGDEFMATATRDQGKTGFVKEFLNKNPQGNVQAVNEAWAAAGKDGTIGSTLINKMRSQMGLTGNLRAKPKSKAAAKGKPSPKQSRSVTETPGKTSFLKEFLHDNAQGNVAAVNAAWQAQGFAGTISPALVNKTRASMGLTGNLRVKTKKSETAAKAKAPYTGKKRGRKPKEATAAVNGQPTGQPRGRKSGRSLALEGLEADIDRLLFKAMEIGNLTEVEDMLRRVRRSLYGALTQG